MMNQGGRDGYISAAEHNSLQAHNTDSTQGYTPSYHTSSASSDAMPWTSNITVNSNIANMNFPINNSDQNVEPSRNIQDGSSLTSAQSTSISGAVSVPPQEYNTYAAYSNTNSHGYSNNGYAGYYSGYQPQSNQPYAQPQSNQPYAQPQSNQPYAQPQSNQPYAQPQSNQPYAQPQSNQPYAQPVGAYQNTGAPYQPNSSFQNTSSYAGTQNYSSSYYNHGDYQTSGVYPSGGYINPTNSWNEGNYGSYASHQYPNYNPDTSGAYSSTSAAAVAASPVQYQQNYKQWPDYYSQTEVTCAPGTEKVSVAVASTTNPLASVPATSGYQTFGQASTPLVPTWRPNSCPSELPSVQTGAVVATGHDGYWKHGTPTFINQSISPQQPQYQLATETNDTYQNVQDQLKTSGPQASVQYPAVHQMHHNYQVHAQPSQPVSSVDSRRLSTLQIPTNPRIAPNLPLDLAKSSMETSMISTAEKPVYISVSVPKQTDKTSLQGGADSMLKPGMFPKSLRGYVERALARCKDDSQKAACQAIMKDVITKATANGTLLTHDWDMEPLFHLPSVDEINKDLHYAPTVSSLSKNKRSPSKRPKSRWEPVPDEKPVVKSFAAVAAAAVGSVKFSGWGGFNDNNKKFSTGKPENRGGLSNVKLSSSEPKNINKIPFRPAKRQRPGESLDVTDNGDASSDSDKEQSLTAYYPSATTLANTPEEKKKRENRSKRFDKGDRHHGEMNHYRPKNVRAGNLYARRANALVLSKNFEDSTAVEDIDWDALTVKGTCQEIEKRYLRLTSAPDPSSVRPEEVLEKALLMVQTAQKNYLYKCDQLKSIRQDLTVQRIRNELTVKVYETHARLAIESGDLPEYNQCQSQLQTLYAEGIKGCHMEFSAYNLLCVMLHSTSSRYLVSAMSRLQVEAKEDEAVKHALAVRRAFTAGNYVLFFRLYKNAPNLNTCLMDLHVEKMRYTALKCMSRACRPTVSIPYIAQVLGFNHALATCEMIEEKIDGLEECMEWLKAHGACLISDNTGEMQLDAKASSTTIYMPEPEDAVAHGDPNLAVNDFFAKNVQ